MALEVVELRNKLVLSFELGTNHDGKVLLKRKTENVRPDVSDEDVNEVADTLANLVEYPLYEKRRNAFFVYAESI